jgi:2-haloacid dehalogenase
VNSLADIQLLAFDVFGTVVDWRGSVAREVQALGLGIDGAAFADAWRERYLPAMKAVRKGTRDWVNLDTLHRENLEGVLQEFGIADRLDDAARSNLNRAWHRLDPWSDTVEGLARLKTRFVVTTLSNGNIGLLTNLSKRAALPWDCILSAETFKAYKPDPRTYLGVAGLFDLNPAQVMLCAAHATDLRAAAKSGLRTAYIDRPLEWGPDRLGDVPGPEDRFDFSASSIDDLARQLGC